MRILIVAVVLAAVGLLVYFGWSTPAPPEPPTIDPNTGDFALPEDVRNYVWSVEQKAFLLAAEAAPALGTTNAEPWRAAMTADCAVTVLRDRGAAVTHGPFTRTERRTPTKADFTTWLATIPHTRVSVHPDRLRPRSRDAIEGPYDATWTITLTGERRVTTIRCALELLAIPASGHGRDWISSIEVTSCTEMVARGVAFEDATSKSGIDTGALVDLWGLASRDDAPAHTSLNTYLLDHDGDGALDVLFTDRRLLLYRGRNDGTFEDVTVRADLETPSSWSVFGATVIDVDDDGDEDLLVDVIQGTRGFNVAYENRGDGTFRRRRDFEQLGGAVSNGAVADFDNDGLVDVYLCVAGARLAESEQRARWIGDRTRPEGMLLRNRGGWRFEDVTVRSGVVTDHRDIFAAAWTDIEPDGDPDLVLVNHMGDNLLFTNRGDGAFARSIVADDFGGFSMGIAVGDLDEDGDPDAYVANMSSSAGDRIIDNLRADDYPAGIFRHIEGFIQGNVVLHNDGGTLREHAPQTAGWAYGPATIDIDGDGRLDVYCPAGFQSVRRGKPDG